MVQTNKMDITRIPFSRMVGIQNSDKTQYILMLKEQEALHNHLSIMHAGALFTLAESTSGEFLLRKFNHLPMDIVPLIRKAEIKYSKPGKGTVYSSASFVASTVSEIEEILREKKRVSIKVRTDLYNEQDQRLLSAVFEWFVSAQSD